MKGRRVFIEFLSPPPEDLATRTRKGDHRCYDIQHQGQIPRLRIIEDHTSIHYAVPYLKAKIEEREF